jgi:autotransporter adhesin
MFDQQTKLILKHIVTADGMSSVATGGTGTNGKQGGVPFLDNSSDDDTGNHKQINLFNWTQEINYNPSRVKCLDI